MNEKKIGGVEYRVDYLPAKEAYELLTRIMQIAGAGAQHLPVIAQGALKVANDKADDFLYNSASLHASTTMIKEAGVNEIVSLKADVLSIAEVKQPSNEYRQVELDVDFLGKLSQAEELFNHIIKVQFSDFTKGDAANGQIALALQLITAIFQSPNSKN